MITMTINYLKLIVLTILLTYVDSFPTDGSRPSPLILIPGDGGSRAYSHVNYKLVTINRLVWVNFEYMLLPGQLTNVFKLTYNPTTHNTTDAVGSQVYFPGWGDTKMIEDLDEWKHAQTTYFSPLVQEMMKDAFYVRNRTIRGAPYDFRKAPNENLDFVPKLKSLIEETYKFSNNSKVVILGHSLGSLYSLYFFSKMTDNWKQKYIRTYMSVSAPLGGSVKALLLDTSGDSIGSPRNPFYFRDMERSFPSTSFLLPRPEIYGNLPLIITDQRNYSSHQYEDIFRDLDYPDGLSMLKDTWRLIDTFKPPTGISELHCIHGYGVETINQLNFTGNHFPDSAPNQIKSDGDSTVSTESLQVCSKWPKVKYVKLKNADHMGIVAEPEFLNILKQVLYRKYGSKFDIKHNDSLSRSKFIIRMF